LSIEGKISAFITIGERISRLPTNERQYYRKAVSETYRVLDNAIGLPIEKLYQILPIQDETTFVNELRLLDSFTQWRDKEREVKLCEPLQEVAGELDATVTKFKDKFAIRDRNELRNLIEQLRQERSGVAYLIRGSMESLSSMASDVDNSSEYYQKLREALRNKIKALDDLRQELHESEMRFKDALSTSSKK
jgi:gas vesicle protein